jgi:hypothetical protein
MDRFVVLALGFGTGYANDSGEAVFLNDLSTITPIHKSSTNLDLLIIQRDALLSWTSSFLADINCV